MDRVHGPRRPGGLLRRATLRSIPLGAGLVIMAFALSAFQAHAEPLSAVLEKRQLLEAGESVLTLAFWQDALDQASQLLNNEAGWQWLASSSLTLALTYFSLVSGTALIVLAARGLRGRSARISPAFPLLRLLAGIAAPLAVNWILIEAMWGPSEPSGAAVQTALLTTAITAISLSSALAILSPADQSRRLLPIRTGRATAASLLTLTAAFIFGASIVFERAGGPPTSHEHLVAGARALMVFAVAALLFAGLRVLAKGRATASSAPATSFPIKPGRLGVLAAAISAGAVCAATFGYIALGWFLSLQLLWIGTLICVTYVVWAVLDRLSASHREAIAQARGSADGANLARFQAPAVLLGMSRLVLILVAFLLALSPFGMQPGETLGGFFKALGAFRVGSIVISLPKILVAILIVALVMAIGRGIQRWLDEDLFPTTRLDASLRDALQSSVRYFAIVLGLALAFVYLGIDIQNVALIASALSIGIGFGLQSIVSNFISGLILLSERRIRKGDWVVVGAEEGFVRNVAIRATEIETFDNATVVIPNSNLVSGVVKNWLMPDRSGRIRIAVSVSYEADTDRVVKVLSECARRHPEVLAHPEPQALLMRFADSGIDFELRCRIRNIAQHPKVRSDLSLAILREFRATGIEIAFPRRDVRVVSESAAARHRVAAE